jgi:Beta-propeller repeat
MTSVKSKPKIVLKAIILLVIAASLAGCSGGMGSSGGATTPPPAGGTAALSPAASFYVINQNYLPSTILQFSRTANGSVAPASTIAGPAEAGFISLTVDALGSLYVGAQVFSGGVSLGTGPEIGPEILVYAPGTTGTQSPSQTITAGLQALSTNTIAAIAVDSAQNLYAVTGIAVGTGPNSHGYTGVAVFAPNASGAFAPSKTIVGPLTGISNNASQMATDAAGNLYIASGPNISPGSIEIFSSAATGNVAPTATLAGANTTIDNAQGVAVDTAGNIYVSSSGLNGPATILKFSAGSSGNVAPVQAITGDPNSMGSVGNLRVDSTGNLYVVEGSTILKFAPGAKGNVAPIATISSGAFTNPSGPIAVQ